MCVKNRHCNIVKNKVKVCALKSIYYVVFLPQFVAVWNNAVLSLSTLPIYMFPINWKKDVIYCMQWMLTYSSFNEMSNFATANNCAHVRVWGESTCA
jgi:hypothetical protein